ncbi:YjeF N-terminal domain-containing protein [Xylogone sp. PMI_703]|nr:YjeF N-terminal domain-containing protein [Xylogone sp. PMI_703]
MSNQFIGLTMLVTLSSPYGAQLRGTVSSVVPGQSLTLRDVLSPATGKHIPEFTIKASEIVELVEAKIEQLVPPVTHAPLSNPIPKPKTFEDPAILSVGKRPTPTTQPPITIPTSQPRLETPDGRRSLERIVITTEERIHRDAIPPSSIVEPMRNVRIEDVAESSTIERQILEELEAGEPEPEVLDAPAAKSASRRRRRKVGRKGIENAFQEQDAIPAKETTRSKGWRQTPLLEPSPSFQPFTTLKRRKGRGRMEENGWATEDATDVQDMGDFDFAGSLAKFDKHTIFNQIQAEDEIPEEDRLVSHNRLPRPRPGTAGGKNLHYTENVLDTPNGVGSARKETWHSEPGETEVEERGSGSGRHSRRGESKRATSRRPTVSRKGSAITSSQMSRSNTLTTVVNSQPSFFLVPSEQRCEPISSLQMLNLENIAANELGLSEDMMGENAGRGIAEVAMSALNASKGSRSQLRSISVQTVFVFAGNNRSGVRAIAGARQLQNHGVNVLVTVLGLERESELLEDLRRQLKVFRNFGGKVLTKIQLFEQAKSLEAPVDLIIDGLLGLAVSFEELRTGDQATAYELIEWANRSGTPVLAIDIPTGIDPSSGKVSIIDGRQLYIHSKYVVAMGVPKKGLLEAMAFEGDLTEEGSGKGRDWQLFIADIGLGAAVWKKAGTRVRRGVEFQGSWVLGMRFQRSAE